MYRYCLAALAFGLSIQSADACHRFSRWIYPYPQRCGVTGHMLGDKAPVVVSSKTPDNSWHVEIVREPGWELFPDLRTPDQVKDFDEHYIELAKRRDEINARMVILHAEEDAARAARAAGLNSE